VLRISRVYVYQLYTSISCSRIGRRRTIHVLYHLLMMKKQSAFYIRASFVEDLLGKWVY